MDAIRWKQIKEVYDRALDLCGNERDGFLAEACGDDDDLRREVESLLAAHEDAGTFLQSPAVEVAATRCFVLSHLANAIWCKVLIR